MKPIQLILFLLLSFLVLVYFGRFRSRLLDRIAVLSLGMVGFAFVAKPDWSTVVAQFLGVGRGADLLTYLGLLGLAFLLLLSHAELRALDTRVTDLVRSLAIEHARAHHRNHNLSNASAASLDNDQTVSKGAEG